MGIHRFIHLLDHGHKKSLSGHLIRINYQQVALETGLPGELFQWDFQKFGHLATPTWISACWKFADENNIKIVSNNETPATRRTHDRYLMPCFEQYGLTKTELGRLNRCRLFLQAITIADITTIDGKHIRPECLRGHHEPSNDLTRHDLAWPNQERPSTHDWTVWQKALATLTNNHPHYSLNPLRIGRTTPTIIGDGTMTPPTMFC